MISTITIPIRDALDGEDTLAGYLRGEAARPRLDREVRAAQPGSILLLDLDGIAILTSSYFLASLWRAFWDTSMVLENDLYPILYRPSLDVAEEIEMVLRERGAPALFGSGTTNNLTVRPYNLDLPASETLDLVTELGQATAADLFERKKDIGQTAWNNRLALLHRQRILRREKMGRHLVYAPCWT